MFDLSECKKVTHLAPNTNISEHHWIDVNGKVRRAIMFTTTYSDEQLVSDGWFNEVGGLHREDGPAYTRYRFGVKYSERWLLNDTAVHDDNQPYEITYHNSGIKHTEAWGYEYDDMLVLDRKNGKPAYIEYDQYCKPTTEVWADNGKEYTLNELADYIALSDEDKVALKLAFD